MNIDTLPQLPPDAPVHTQNFQAGDIVRVLRVKGSLSSIGGCRGKVEHVTKNWARISLDETNDVHLVPVEKLVLVERNNTAVPVATSISPSFRCPGSTPEDFFIVAGQPFTPEAGVYNKTYYFFAHKNWIPPGQKWFYTRPQAGKMQIMRVVGAYKYSRANLCLRTVYGVTISPAELKSLEEQMEKWLATQTPQSKLFYELAANPITTTIDLVNKDTMDTFTMTKSATCSATLKIEEHTFVNGQNVASMSDDEIFATIASVEAEIKRLSDIKNKPKALLARINELEAGIAKLVEISDKRHGNSDNTKPTST